MMNSRELKYLSCPTAQGFIKPYKDNKYSFAALLPNMDVDIYDFINSLTTESLSNILNNVEDAMVYAAIPKFSYDYSITMNKMLTDMGMPTAFNPLSANFKNMAELVGNNLDVYKRQVVDSIFYGLGKINLMLLQSIVVNSIYYGTAFILFQLGVFQPNLTLIALMFAIGTAFDSILTMVLYFIMLKKENINIFDFEIAM